MRLSRHLKIFIFIFLLAPLSAKAQGTLFLSPSIGSYKVGDSFSILVNINTGGESINASMGQINFDNSRLQVVSLGYSQSIFGLWTDTPSFSNPAGTINFSGGVPSPGFNGTSGGILRITFRGKAVGQAPVSFLSGSILANDGQGTNIADGLKGSVFNITPADDTLYKTVITTPESGSEPESLNKIVEKPIMSTPAIITWPKKLNEGDTLTIEGLGYPSARIDIVIEKGAEEASNGYTFSGPDGKFIFTYAKSVESGYYRAWARNVAADGNQSGLSDPVITEVVTPVFMRIGSIVFDYTTIMIILFSLLLFALLVLLLMRLFYGRKNKKRNIEISEAEQMLEKSFRLLCSDIDEHLARLRKARTERDLTLEEVEFLEQFEGELVEAKEFIGKEIKDISR